jgi:hypothetical protein
MEGGNKDEFCRDGVEREVQVFQNRVGRIDGPDLAVNSLKASAGRLRAVEESK